MFVVIFVFGFAPGANSEQIIPEGDEEEEEGEEEEEMEGQRVQGGGNSGRGGQTELSLRHTVKCIRYNLRYWGRPSVTRAPTSQC